MIRASFVLALVWALSRILRARPAAERHLLWAAGIVAAALLPALSMTMPAWRPEAVGRMLEALPSFARIIEAPAVLPTSGAVVRAIGIENGDRWYFLLTAIWVIGAAGSLVLLLSGIRSGRRLASAAIPLSDPTWNQTTRRIAGMSGITRPVTVLQGPDYSPPLTWGLVRPSILLPRQSSEWSESRRFSVLAHEMQHVRRGDWLVQLFAEAVCVVYWFHPLFWIARNRLHLEAERACDDAVLRLGVDGRDYAQHLLDIARSMKQTRRTAWSVSMAGAVPLEKRLVAVLSEKANRTAMTWRNTLVLIVACAALVLPLAAMRLPDADSSQQPQVLRYTMPPLYSDEARRRSIEGAVTVEARIDGNGRPSELRVVRGLGFGLDENALLAVRNWEFSGAENKSPVRVEVEFSLQTAELNEMIANDMVTQVGPDVVPPKLVHRVDPTYRLEGMNTPAGSVVLDAVIQDNGVPKVLRVLRSLSWEVDEAAIGALEQWRFTPAEKDGAPVKVRINVEMPVASANR